MRRCRRLLLFRASTEGCALVTDPRRDSEDVITKLGDIAASAGLRRVTILAWRDLDDPEAGGSELHAARVAELWGRAGIEVTMRTSYAPGTAQVTWRDGYRVIRKAGRYMVFPRAAFSEMMGWHGASDGLVEIWNGMPFFSPVWARRPRVVWLHHVHDSMWEMTLPPRLARLGRTIEFRVAPPLYRGVPDRHAVAVVEGRDRRSSLRLRAADITRRAARHRPVVHARATSPKEPTPLVVAVGRLVPVKRFHLLIDALGRDQGTSSRAARGDRRRGLRARRARGADRRARRGRVDLAARARRRRRAARRSTGARGCSRARRRTKAGA